MRRKHVGCRHAQLLGGIHSHAEDQHGADQEGKAVHSYRKPDRNRTDQRQGKPKKNACFAAVSIRNLANRVGDEKTAESDQAD